MTGLAARVHVVVLQVLGRLVERGVGRAVEHYNAEVKKIRISAILVRSVVLKVIRKFFFNHNKSFRWHLGDYEKHDFFLFEGL